MLDEKFPQKSLCSTYDPSTCSPLRSLQAPVSLDIREKQPNLDMSPKILGRFFPVKRILGDINRDPPLVKLNAKTCFL